MTLVANAMQAFRESRASIEGPGPLTAARVVEWLAGPATATGVRVSAEGALKITAAYACIRVISEDVASLPLITYERMERGKKRATGHPLYGLLHDMPNPHMTSMQMRETMMAHVLSWGNAYANIERDPFSGRIRWLWPLRPDRMDRPVLASDGRLLYTYHLPNGEPAALTQDDVMHLRGLSGDGVMGYSPVALHRETLGWSVATKEYGARFFGNDSRPGGVLQAKSRLSDEAAKRLRDGWTAAHQGLTNSHRVAVLEEGIEWKQIGIAPEDAQYLETMTFQVQDIARIYRVPPHMIAEMSRSTFANIEEQGINYVVNTLRSWLVRSEQQYNVSLLTEAERRTLFVEHLIDGLLRGKYLERQQGLQVQRQNGIINADDWNEIENRNPLPDGIGQHYVIPANMNVLGPDGPMAVQQPDAPQPTAGPAADGAQ